MKKIFILTFLIGMVSSQQTEKFVVNGYIKDSETNESLPYANVVIKNTMWGTTTNSDGYFALKNIPKGQVTLLVSYIGFETKTISLSIQLIEEGPVEVLLSPKALEGESVEVVGESYEIFQSSGVPGQMTISTRDIQTLPSIGEVDIFNSLKLFPGISGIGDGKSGIYVRGGTPDQNLVILDGMTVYHVDHFFGMFSAFNANAVKDVQVYKGGFPAKYGGRLSSVLDLTGKRGGTERGFTLGGNLLSGNMSYETPLFGGKGNWIINGRRSYTDILQGSSYRKILETVTGKKYSTNSKPNFMAAQGGGPIGGSFQQDILPSFYYYDLNSKLSLNPTDRDILSLSLYFGRDFLDKSRKFNLGIPVSDGSLDNNEFPTLNDKNVTHWGNLGTSLKWGHQWDLMYTNLLISGSKFTSVSEQSVNFDDGNSNEFGSFAQNENNKVNDYAIRLDNRLPIGKSHDVEFGLFLNSINTDYEANFEDTISIVGISSKSEVAALYAQDNWQIFKKLDITLGLRSSYFVQTDKVYNAPRISFGLDIFPRVRLKGAWGHYYQFINTITNENVLEGSKEFWLASNKNILPGFAEHSILGISYDTPNYLFEVEGYYKELENLVEFSRRFKDHADFNNYFFFGTGTARGIEFLAQKKKGKVTGWLSYTLGQVQNKFPNLNKGKSFFANHDRNHELKLVASYKFGDGWTLSSTNMFASGNPYTAPMNRFALTLLNKETLSYIHVENKNGFRLPDYKRLDISLSRKWFTDHGEFEGGLSLYNILNNKNISYRSYNLSTTPIIASDITMLGFTPTIFINFQLR